MIKFLVAAAGILLSNEASAVQADTATEQMRLILRTACSIDEGEVDRYSLDVDAQGQLVLRGFRPGAEGELRVDRQTIDSGDTGAIGDLLLEDEANMLEANRLRTECTVTVLPMLMPLFERALEIDYEDSSND